MKKKLLIGVLIGLVLLLTGCVPMIRNPISLVLLILDVAVQIVAAIGVLYAAYQRFRAHQNSAGNKSPAPTHPARLPGNSFNP